jgi:hypothetical protein
MERCDVWITGCPKLPEDNTLIKSDPGKPQSMLSWNERKADVFGTRVGGISN